MARDFDMHLWARRARLYDDGSSRTEARAERGRDPSAETLEFRDADGTCYRYIELDEGLVVLTRCVPARKDITVPDVIEGMIVVGIGPSAFARLSTVVSIVCPPRIRDIGSRAFEGCSALERLTLPLHVSRFDPFWIRGCVCLDRLVLPGDVESLGSGLFESCSPRRLVIGRGTREVADAFFTRTSLERLEVDSGNLWLATDGHALMSRDGTRLVSMAVRTEDYAVPDGCQTIGRKAFAYDRLLRTVTLPDTVEVIEPFAFAVSSLERFVAPASLRSIGKKAFFRCHRLTRIGLNDGLKTIGEEAFAKSSIARLDIPASVDSIGRQIVEGTAVSFDGAEPSFTIASENPHLFVHDGGLYRRDEEGLVLAGMLSPTIVDCHVLPGTVKIGARAFLRQGTVRSVVLPEGVRSVEKSAFRGCRALRRVAFPESLETIGTEAFLETSLENLYLPAGLRHIGKFALATRGGNFDGASPTLNDVRVHPACDTFYLASGLLCERMGRGESRVVLYVGPERSVAIPREAVVIASYAFSGVRTVRELHIHAGVRKVGLQGFAVGRAVERLVIELPEPVRGHESVEMRFPDSDVGRRAMMLAFKKGVVDAEEIYRYHDSVILSLDDPFDRARQVLDRLVDPLYLNVANRTRFESMLSRGLPALCRVFAEHGCAMGFGRLADLGFLNEDNITKIIDDTNGVGDAAVTGYLLEMKRRRFGSRVDFEL